MKKLSKKEWLGIFYLVAGPSCPFISFFNIVFQTCKIGLLRSWPRENIKNPLFDNNWGCLRTVWIMWEKCAVTGVHSGRILRLIGTFRFNISWFLLDYIINSFIINLVFLILLKVFPRAKEWLYLRNILLFLGFFVRVWVISEIFKKGCHLNF